LANPALSTRSIGPAQPLCPLAGVLLGKTSLNSLYGLMGWLPQTVSQFWRSWFGRCWRARGGVEWI